MTHAATILYVEDNPENRLLIRRILQAEGYHVLEAQDAGQALDMVRGLRPDLILMDIQLPEVSGLEVTKWLKSDAALRNIPVIAVTAFAMKGACSNSLTPFFGNPASAPLRGSGSGKVRASSPRRFTRENLRYRSSWLAAVIFERSVVTSVTVMSVSAIGSSPSLVITRNTGRSPFSR